MGKYFGLRGTSLNIVIGAIAGLDFLLFGYDQGVTGGLLNLKSFYTEFPEIDASPTSLAYTSLSPAAKNHRTTIQGTYSRLISHARLPHNLKILLPVPKRQISFN